MSKRDELIGFAKGMPLGYWIEHKSDRDSYCVRHNGDDGLLLLRHPKDGIPIAGRLYGLSDEEIKSLTVYETGKKNDRPSLFVESQDIEMIFGLINRQ